MAAPAHMEIDVGFPTAMQHQRRTVPVPRSPSARDGSRRKLLLCLMSPRRLCLDSRRRQLQRQNPDGGRAAMREALGDMRRRAVVARHNQKAMDLRRMLTQARPRTALLSVPKADRARVSPTTCASIACQVNMLLSKVLCGICKQNLKSSE